jgi:hypothetical protein
MHLRNIPKHFLKYSEHEEHTGIPAGYSCHWMKELQGQTCPRRYIDWSFLQVPAWVDLGWLQGLTDDPWMVALGSHLKASYPGYRDSKHHR